ncbi:MAG: YccS family putative transporter [Pseudomonadota bacterium]|nr:YccS family putative transporter [Pseudomonadota bacterium]
MNTINSIKRISYNTTLMYAVRMLIAFAGTAFIPYLLGQQLLTIPLTLGVIAAALSDIDDRFSIHLRNLFFTYFGFFVTASAVELLFPHPILFGFALIVSCFSLILLGSLGKRYATISYGCLVVSVYTMLGVDIFPEWWQQPALLVTGAVWYGLLSSISFLIFPVRLVQDQLVQCYQLVGNFLFVKSNLFDVDMTPKSYQQSMIDLSLANSKVVGKFNETRVALVTRLKGDRGRKDTRRSLQYYFIIQDIHERADSAHIDYQKLAKIFAHRDVLFRFQRILTLQGKACQDLANAVANRQPYVHDPRFAYAFKNLERSIQHLQDELAEQSKLDGNGELAQKPVNHLLANDADIDLWINALRGLSDNLKEIDAQLHNLESDQALNSKSQDDASKENLLRDDGLRGWQDIWQRMKQNLSPESSLFRHATRLSILLLISHILVQVFDFEYGYWILLTVLFVSQPNFNATKRRLRLRIIGTLAGITIGTFVIHFVPSIEGQLFIMVLSGVFFLQLRAQQYAQATMFITLLALINFHLADPELNAALPRAIYTFVGCFIAWLGVMFIWPDWQFRRLPLVINKAFDSQCNYLTEIVKQYHEGRNHGLDYRIVRRRAHIMDADLASTISTLATEPDIDPDQKQQAFKLLSLNHTLLSYIAALGAHREQIKHPQVLEILDEALDDIHGALLRNEMPQLKSHAAIQALRLFNRAQDTSLDPAESVVLQQIALIINILPEISTLKQKLSYEHDPQASALGSI